MPWFLWADHLSNWAQQCVFRNSLKLNRDICAIPISNKQPILFIKFNLILTAFNLILTDSNLILKDKPYIFTSSWFLWADHLSDWAQRSRPMRLWKQTWCRNRTWRKNCALICPHFHSRLDRWFEHSRLDIWPQYDQWFPLQCQ